MSTVIKIENISKLYRLGTIGSGTLQNDLKRWWAKINKKDDPFQKLGERNVQNRIGKSDLIWALKDINLEIQEGDVLGIIGNNGAGKSTLLKVLSRITSPTTGFVKIKGRIASLLEIGTGFHPDLSGRENIYLNGAILGMSKREITAKLDEIIDFSGIERYIDTPVKRYSSGMYVRLAFAVAAHLEPEILLIDEVLAVGDYSFQEKCLGKMRNISEEGRTVLFVSHNLGSIRSLCKNAILLENGIVDYYNSAEKTVETYINSFKDKMDGKSLEIKNDLDAYVEDINVTDLEGNPLVIIPLNTTYRLVVQVFLNKDIVKFILGIGFNTLENVALRTIWSKPVDLKKGRYKLTLIEDKIFYTGKYNMQIGLSMANGKVPLQNLPSIMTIKFEDYIDSQIAIDSKSGLIINQENINIESIN
jgi:ABC-type polysaccharide/polyol phosphate transport system ATPase subunit